MRWFIGIVLVIALVIGLAISRGSGDADENNKKARSGPSLYEESFGGHMLLYVKDARGVRLPLTDPRAVPLVDAALGQRFVQCVLDEKDGMAMAILVQKK